MSVRITLDYRVDPALAAALLTLLFGPDPEEPPGEEETGTEE